MGGLYVEEKTHDPDEIIQSHLTKTVVMHFVRNVDAEDIRKAWTAGFEKNAGEKLTVLSNRIGQLNHWMSMMHVGDRMMFVLDRGNVTVNVKGVRRGTISGEDVSRAMLPIWFGPGPPNESLKRGMLGLER